MTAPPSRVHASTADSAATIRRFPASADLTLHTVSARLGLHNHATQARSDVVARLVAAARRGSRASRRAQWPTDAQSRRPPRAGPGGRPRDAASRVQLVRAWRARACALPARRLLHTRTHFAAAAPPCALPGLCAACSYIPRLRKPAWAPPAPVFGQVGAAGTAAPAACACCMPCACASRTRTCSAAATQRSSSTRAACAHPHAHMGKSAAALSGAHTTTRTRTCRPSLCPLRARACRRGRCCMG